MSPRIKLRAVASPLLMAGALWGSAPLAGSAAGGPGQTPPPCSPDGDCLPRPQTHGYYATRWRPFPGDRIAAAPTPTDAQEERQQQEDLRGPQLPEPAAEGQVGPPRSPRASSGPADTAAAPAPGVALPGLPELPVGEPLPDAVPPAEDAAPEAAPPTAPPTPPPTAPPGNELDPFGAASPRGPLRIVQPVAAETNIALPPAVAYSAVKIPAMTVPAAMAPGALLEAIPQLPAPPADGPNLHGDDAPPALPAGLQRMSRTLPPRPAPPSMALHALPPVVQPASVRPTVARAAVDRPIVDHRVAPASDDSPLGIQLINPAAALADEGTGGLRQAIYYEARD